MYLSEPCVSALSRSRKILEWVFVTSPEASSTVDGTRNAIRWPFSNFCRSWSKPSGGKRCSSQLGISESGAEMTMKLSSGCETAHLPNSISLTISFCSSDAWYTRFTESRIVESLSKYQLDLLELQDESFRNYRVEVVFNRGPFQPRQRDVIAPEIRDNHGQARFIFAGQMKVMLELF